MLSIQDVGVGPMTVNATAAMIVRNIQSLYQVGVNRTLVTYQLVETLSDLLLNLTGQPLSTEAMLHWCNQLQIMQLQSR